MSNRVNRRRWSREETLAAFALYLYIPTNRISYEEDASIIQLATALDRTPGSVALKLQNLLANDPNANRKGLSNSSRLDKQIWVEYAEREDAFVEEAIAAYRLAIDYLPTEKTVSENHYDLKEGHDSPVASSKRLNQSYFRKSLLSLYGGRCCVTDLGVEPLLVASYIKPWADADPLTERVNVENGLLLNPLHDKAFDAGLITLDRDYKIVMSQELLRRANTADNSEALHWLMCTRGRRIRLPEHHRPNLAFIEYHQDVIFRG